MALFSNKKINLLAAADTDSENLSRWQKYAKKHGSKALTFTSSDELYNSVQNLDIITVAVNEESHLQECIKAIEYRPKLVILEKPVALNSEEAGKILAASKKYNVPVMVNHERRFSKDYILARKLMSEIGELQSIHAELDSGLRVYAKEFEKDGTYSLLHDGTHLVDIVQYLLTSDRTVSGVEPQKQSQLPDTEQNNFTDTELSRSVLTNPVVTGIFKDEKNIVRNFSAHYTTEKVPDITIKMSGRSKFFEFRIEILGTLGKITVGNGIHEFSLRKESKLYSGFYSLTPQKVKFPEKTCYFSGMIQNAVDFLDKKSGLLSPLEDAISDLQVLEEIKSHF